VVFTSDHGESLHEHGESTHGYFVYQSTLRVPLIIHWPSPSSSFATRIEEPASLLNIAPTLPQIVGVERPVEFQGHNLLSHIASPHIPNEVKRTKRNLQRKPLSANPFRD
jgi:arylsulfatase A-like enzyme